MHSKSHPNKLEKIIYIDDQMDILLVAEYALTKIGNYDVLMCESGTIALAKIEKFKPDLIVLDVMMPELDGPQVLSKIREIKPFKNTPVIFITAKIFPNEIVDLMSCDADVISVIPKPFDPITISDTIQSTWNSSLSKENKINQENLS